MTGNLYRGQAGLPFSSTLRVYEPLDAFPEDQRAGAQGCRRAGSFARRGGERRAAGLAGADHAARRRSVPHGTDRPGAGHPAARAFRSGTKPRRILPARKRSDGDGLLYCPSQLVLRAGLAANALMEGIHGPLAELLIPEEQRDRHQERIDQVNAREGITRVHTRASTWGIPFSWFSLFLESDPQDVVEAGGRILTVRVSGAH